MNQQMFRKGVSRKDDLLLVFTRSSVTAVKVWPKPAGWVKKRDSGWRNIRPEIDLRLRVIRKKLSRAKLECRRQCPDYLQGQTWIPGTQLPWPADFLRRKEQELATFSEVFETIPKNVRSLIKPFQERHFSLLSFAARCPGGLDLIDSTAALAFMLANSWVFREPVQRPLRSARALLRRTQREQLQWLNWPVNSKSAISILRKIPPQSCTIETMLYLRQAMADSFTLKLLAHLPRINRGVVRIVSDSSLVQVATPNLLIQVGLSRKEDKCARTAYHVKKLLEFLDRNGRDISNLRIPSIGHLQERYAWLQALIKHREAVGNLQYDFPPPPLPGTEEIVPITNLEALALEGQEQKHCILRCTAGVHSGKAYIYKVLGENRATVLIRPEHREHRTTWFLCDCRGTANSRPGSTTLRKIETWLSSCQTDKLSRYEIEDHDEDEVEPPYDDDVEVPF